MNFDEYREFYIKGIKNTALSEGIHPIDAFINDISDMMLNDFNLIDDAMTLCQYEYNWNSTNRAIKSMKIDAYSVNPTSNTVNLLVANFNEGPIQTITNETKDKLSERMLNFFENVLKGFFKSTEQSAPYTQASFQILSDRDVIDKIHLFIISTDKISERVKDLLLNPLVCQGHTYKVQLDVIDFNRIYKTKAAGFEKEDIVIKTEDFGLKGIPCIKAQIGTETYDSYLAIIPGDFLANIYDRYGSRLLESNVRSFLSFRGGINKGIRGTILNAPEKFFTYNNGISTTAKDVTCKYFKDEGMMITEFVDFQIINGGQTTASLASTQIKDGANLRGIYVQMKLTVVKENDPEFVRNIAKYANSQNKVTSADLNSNHPFYTRIEDLSRKIYAPAVNGNPYQELWFFERARGQYEQPMMKMTTQKQREDYQKIRPKDKKFTKTDLAKYINSANMQPYNVSWGAEVNSTKFQEQMEKVWERNEAIFNEFYYKELIGMAIVYKSLEKIISKQDWYIENRAYRPQLVTYTFSKFVYEASKLNKKVNYKDIWDKQAIRPSMETELAKIAKLAFDNINGDRELTNISSYCKQEKCWERLKDRPYTLSRDVYECLISEGDRNIEMSRAKKEQRNDTSISYAIEIVNKGVFYWQNLINKATEQRVLNDYEIQMLKRAKNSCNTGSITNKEANEIFKIVEKLKEVGIE